MLNRSIFLITLLGTSSLFASNYSLSVSADATKFDYAETDSSGSLLDTERADFGKVSGLSVTMEPRYEGLYFSASYANGNTDYVGSLIDSGDPYGSYKGITTNEVSDYNFGYKSTARDPRGGWEMPVTIGVGYRRWLRQLGYDELYDWGYYNVGIGLHYRMSSIMTIGADASYRKAFSAQMYENWHGYTYNLNNVYGYKITVPFELKINQALSTFIAYNYEFWNIDKSNSVGGYYEPDSETNNETVSFGFKFNF
ncbi:hypothetical protein [Sulfuricurvum sp.]|uniref:hypothetical protein n=1 Tax=Sulfuricurvum sp. TaxID=2025608 RepID=UPI002E357794|nr:hypothetical protein [Sulfuricurvum sp.]HEX5330865.1 hypothetical protein [Sulfuricurvum sp.]